MRAKFGGIEVSDAKRLKTLENGRRLAGAFSRHNAV
jgi:hypothetical protein